ncbi:hypothetical protein [Eubacterium sp. 1001713B170207_170306_E7]|uniref:UPF0489 family protein n=1 Tax=Eubacterium sp. 1001713B170207_170306_E7 TaxID=2787097 RepID=UPI0018982A75|nr:hypothetical protein [Eubacterium sp. 1001713B170207_170306_E7]
MVDKLLKEQNLRIIPFREKKMYIVDNHQYALLIWAREVLQCNMPGVLVSIDYHPDTNPSFWLYAYQKAIAIDPEREETLCSIFQKKIMEEIDPLRLDTLAEKMPLMRNDEQINTAMELGYLIDYHMINCMEKHCYTKGHHYRVPEEKFGILKDDMFQAAGFGLSSLCNQEKSILILDIDLDYFMKRENFVVSSNEMSVFKKLLKAAHLITCARSATYFEHLKREHFTIEACENALITMLKNLME